MYEQSIIYVQVLTSIGLTKYKILIISYLSCFISSLATLPGMWERTVTIGSAGKTFSVTGWKVRDSAHIIFQLILTKLDYE